MSSDPLERTRRSASKGRRSGSIAYGIVGVLLILVPIAAFSAALVSAQQGTDPAVFLQRPSMIVLVIAAFFAVIFMNGVFSAADLAIDYLRPTHLRQAEAEEQQESKVTRLRDLLERQQLYVAASRLGSRTMFAWMILLCLVPAKLMAGWLNGFFGTGEGLFGIMLGAVVVSIPVVAVNIVFGELIPSTYAAHFPVRSSVRLHGFIRFFSFVFWLPAQAALLLGSRVTHRFGADATFALAQRAEEEIKNLLESYGEQGAIEEEEREMLDSVFDFGDEVASGVMTPRVDLDSISDESTLVDAANMIEETGRSRLPIYHGNDDTILGLVHAKDVLRGLAQGGGEENVLSIKRDVLKVPENKSLHELLQEMRQERIQMAVVQDEYGGTAGIVTIEDIVEEVMGEIVDEYDDDDDDEPTINQNGVGWIVGGKFHLDDLNDEVGCSLDSAEFDTIGGYVFGLFGRQPENGETVESDGFKFTVEDTDGRRIQWVRVEPCEPAEELTAASSE